MSKYYVIEWEVGCKPTLPEVGLETTELGAAREYINNILVNLIDAGYEINEKDTDANEYIALDYLVEDGEIITKYIRIQEVKE